MIVKAAASQYVIKAARSCCRYRQMIIFHAKGRLCLNNIILGSFKVKRCFGAVPDRIHLVYLIILGKAGDM